MIPPVPHSLRSVRRITIRSIPLGSLNGGCPSHAVSLTVGNGHRAGLRPPGLRRYGRGKVHGRADGSGGPRGKRKGDAGGVRYTFIRSNSSELLHSLDDNGWRHAARGTHRDQAAAKVASLKFIK